MAKIAFYTNLLALLPTLGGVILLGFLGTTFLGSHDGSDKTIGWLMLLAGAPLLCSGPVVGLWLALKMHESLYLSISCALGAGWILLGLVSIFMLPGLIEAAVRP